MNSALARIETNMNGEGGNGHIRSPEKVIYELLSKREEGSVLRRRETRHEFRKYLDCSRRGCLPTLITVSCMLFVLPEAAEEHQYATHDGGVGGMRETRVVEKIDFRAERKDLYAPSANEFSVVEVPPMEFAMVDGRGDPNTNETYREAVEALYSVSYAAKFGSKQALARDYVVGPLEGLWDSERMDSFLDRSKDEWSWTMMIRQPEWLTDEVRDAAVAKAAKKNLPGLERLRFERYDEGLSAQIMHIGSYDEEGPVLARLHDEFLPAKGFVETGRHHEIYIGDPRRSAPEKLRTVLRQPVRKA